MNCAVHSGPAKASAPFESHLTFPKIIMRASITTHQDPERHALIVSIVATAGISFLGILWGLAIMMAYLIFAQFSS